MISFEEAIRIISTVKETAGREEIPVVSALNRVLAVDVMSDVDMPPFDKAAMDGFACRQSDLGEELVIVEEIPAGTVPGRSIAANECARIMTGAMVPEGADYIVMKEHATNTAHNAIRCHRKSDHANICYRGEDVKAGDVVLTSGIKLKPAHLAMLAASGCARPTVYTLPRVAVISTGSELVEPDQIPGTGKIRNSNGIQLVTQSMQAGVQAEYLGIVDDNRETLRTTLKDAIGKYQVILISGGVSVGDYDFVPAVLGELGVDILIHGMNVKPGKHMLFGRRENHYVIGMPGNPVSSFVLFEMLVKPLFNGLTGNPELPGWLSLPLAMKYSRKKNDTLFFIPVAITPEGTALPLEYHGSAHIHAYAGAGGIMEVAVGVNEMKQGEMVHVRPI
jgi:molybdopterin molybdotransferase